MSIPLRPAHASTRRFKNHWQPSDRQHLEQGMQQLGLTLSGERMDRLNRWAALVLQWNQTYNLLGSNDSQVLIDNHLLDSLAALPALTRHLPDLDAPLADIGSGAGFPGILLAIAHPERPITLVEPVGKKAAFLRQSALTLGLRNVSVCATRIENLTRHEVGGSDPNFICRAFTALARYASLCEPFMSERSLAFAMKSVRLRDEQRELPASVQMHAVESLPCIHPDTQRFLAVLKLTSPPPLEAIASSSETTDNRRLA
ncbi:MAG: 16S rRNA (guanine(527)-N(7))-methyltransferase RsmG [Lautropia sp.]|nr:16S rRNA (guanine(527)-N(7))-methyltransferase RsmG [Lautropia sp.]